MPRKKIIKKTPMLLLEELKALLGNPRDALDAQAKLGELEKVLRERDEEVRLSVADFLEKQGWSVVLVADSGIQGLGDKGRYRYFMDFLGGQRNMEEKKDATPKQPSQ